MENNLLVDLPPHLLLDVLLKHIDDGGNIHDICSSSRILQDRCTQMKAPLLEALRIRLQEEEKIIEAFGTGIADGLKQYSFMENLFKKGRFHSLDLAITKLNETMRGWRLQRIAEIAIINNNLPFLRYIVPRIKKQSRLTTGDTAWVVRHIQEIINDADIEPMLQYLVQLCRQLYGWSNHTIERYAAIGGGHVVDATGWGYDLPNPRNRGPEGIALLRRILKNKKQN